MDVVEESSRNPEITMKKACDMIELNPDRYYRRRARYKDAGLDGLTDRTCEPHTVAHRILPEEKQLVIAYAKEESYADFRHRKLAYQLQNHDIVFVSPSTTYRILKEAGLIKSWSLPAKNNADGKMEITKPNQVWHTDITYVPVRESHYYLISVLDAYSRYIVHAELSYSMTAKDVSRVVAQALENAGIEDHDHAPALISDNGVQLTAKRFQELLRRFGVEHRRTAVRHPESNGKIEVFHKTLKYEHVYLQDRYESFLQAKQDIERFITLYNTKRLHQAIAYVTPEQRYTGGDKEILEERQRKHRLAKQRRREANRTGDVKVNSVA